MILKKMKEKGIWLVDSSIVGINGWAGKLKKDIILLSWENFIKDVVFNANPRAIVFIGKVVKEALENRTNHSAEQFYQPQPQAHFPAQKQAELLKKYYTICCRFC
mgnify:CR=1 FL=1